MMKETDRKAKMKQAVKKAGKTLAVCAMALSLATSCDGGAFFIFGATAVMVTLETIAIMEGYGSSAKPVPPQEAQQYRESLANALDRIQSPAEKAYYQELLENLKKSDSLVIYVNSNVKDDYSYEYQNNRHMIQLDKKLFNNGQEEELSNALIHSFNALVEHEVGRGRGIRSYQMQNMKQQGR